MLGNRVFRVFVSSTFRDLAAERDALQERVFPELRAHCAAKGYAFQAIDLRWGIREEAAAGKRTMRICLAEVARCQEISPRPNFVVLLGDRYGWRPLPEVVDAAELETLAALLHPEDRSAVRAAYVRDDNAVPPQYVLVPHGSRPQAYHPESLRRSLAGAASRAGYPDAVLAKYSLSATEQEIVKGAFEAEDAAEHIFCFLRELSGLPDHVPPAVEDTAAPSPVLDYGDYDTDGTRDTETRALLADLKSRLREQLGHNAFGYDADWTGTAASTTHIDRLCQDMLSSLKRVIDAEIERLGEYAHLAQEQAAHRAFAEEHVDGFIGRSEYLDTVGRYVDSANAHPLCLFARGGLGKSALVSRAADDACAAHPEAVVVTRFIGVTSASADPRSLLEDLCGEIGAGYGSTEPVPSTLHDLREEFPKRLALASPDHPLLLFLDALDQLIGTAGGNLGWLPAELPPHVRIVTTTRPGALLDVLAQRLPGDLLVEVGGMAPDEGDTLLQFWLERANRMLTSEQRAEIIGRFRLSGSPLYLRLAFEEARLWSSARQDVRIGEDELSLIGQLYDRLEAEHGAELVGHALGFLACTFEHLGLSEDELLDALTADEQTWSEFTAGAAWQLPTRRLPVVVWSRLYFDLAAYLSPRASEGASLMSFFHKELADVAHDRYVAGRAPQLHGVLADVLQALARGRDAGAREWTGSTHALAELPYHLTLAERWDALFATLTDFNYLEEKAKRVAVVTSAGTEGEDVSAYNGVRALIDDYDRAIAAFPGRVGDMDSRTTGRTDQRIALGWFSQVLAREGHNLTRRPELIWQQMYNRLQWAGARDESAKILARLLRPELEERTRAGAGAWLHLLSRLHESGGLLRTLSGHLGYVHAVAYSPDGAHLVSAASTGYNMTGPPAPEDNTLKVWDADDGTELATLTGHMRGVQDVAYSPDGRRVVSLSADDTLKVWDALSWRELATFTREGGLVAIAVSPDGSHIATAGRGTVEVNCSPDGTRISTGEGALEVWDLVSGKTLLSLSGHTDTVGAIAFSPDGTRLVSGSWDRSIRVWDAGTGELLLTLTGHEDGVTSVAFSPDGTRLVSGSGDMTVRVWDRVTGAELLTLAGHASGVDSVAFSPDGSRIASGSGDRTLKIWDAASGARLASLSGHSKSVQDVAYRPDGARIASCSDDGTIKVWEPYGEGSASTAGHDDWVMAVAYSPDGGRVVSGGRDGSLKVWDAAGGTELVSVRGHAYVVGDVAFSPGGTRIAALGGAGNVKILNANDGRELLALPRDEVIVAAWSPDGQRIATGSSDGLLQVWDASTGAELLVLAGHHGQVLDVAYSRDGFRIVSAAVDGTIKVWGDATGSEVVTIAVGGDWYPTAVLCPDGTRIASGLGGGLVKVWDAANGAEALTLVGHTDGVTAVAYSPDGARIVTGSQDRTVRVWEASTGSQVATLCGHTDAVGHVVFSPDSTHVASGSWADRTVRIWDMESGCCIATLPCLGAVRALPCYSPRGVGVCAGDETGTVYIVELRGVMESAHSAHAGGIDR